MPRELGDERTRYGRKSGRERLEDILSWPSDHPILTGVLIAFVFVGLLLSASRGLLVGLEDLATGDCLFARTGTDDEARPVGTDRAVTVAVLDGRVERTSCAASHGHEVSAIVVVPVPTIVPYELPLIFDADALRALTQPQCEAAFAGYVGLSLPGSRYVTFPVLPEPPEWVAGGRRTVCFIARADGQWMDHSARGSGE